MTKDYSIKGSELCPFYGPKKYAERMDEMYKSASVEEKDKIEKALQNAASYYFGSTIATALGFIGLGCAAYKTIETLIS